MPQCFQQKDQPIQTCFLIPLYGYSTQCLSVHLSWMLEHILFQYSPYSAGVNLVCESVICTETPDDAALEACRALGKALVE